MLGSVERLCPAPTAMYNPQGSRHKGGARRTGCDTPQPASPSAHRMATWVSEIGVMTCLVHEPAVHKGAALQPYYFSWVTLAKAYGFRFKLRAAPGNRARHAMVDFFYHSHRTSFKVGAMSASSVRSSSLNGRKASRSCAASEPKQVRRVLCVHQWAG